MRKFVVAFLILVILIALAQYTKPALSVSDQFERARIAGEITETGNFPASFEIYGTELPYVYPPLFDIFSAAAGITTGLDVALLWRLLSFVVLAIIFTYTYKFSHNFLDRNFALMAAVLTALLPWVFKRTAAIIPESIGLAIFIMLLYYLHKKNFLAIAVLMPLLMLTHLRSFGTFTLIFLAVIAYLLFLRTWETDEQRERLALMRKTALAFLPAIVFGAYWIFPRLAALNMGGGANPWVDVVDLIGMFSWLWVIALVPALALLWKKPKHMLNLIFIFGMLFALVFSGTVFGFRELAYLFFPVAFLCATLLQWVKIKINPNLALGLFVLLVLVLLLPNFTWIQQESYFSEQNLSAVRALNKIQGENVLADYMLSYAVPLYTEKHIVIGPFMEQVPGAGERAVKTHGFYEQCLANRVNVARYYPDFVAFTPYIRDVMHCSGDEFNSREWNLLYDNGTVKWHSPAN
ncbi:hypothetical protein KKH30_01450 [Candidatus Micrarchaeota archaeon]|nr:hypothetical protein [Candidatus Micrarchaeota archaeon]MBU1939407.1 hypothetical protein [Candidatus Micrarchaeota archaeon]